MFTPYALVMDVELIKRIMIGEFKSFKNNDFAVSETQTCSFGTKTYVT